MTNNTQIETVPRQNDEEVLRIAIGTPFDQDQHDLALPRQNDADEPDNVRSILTAPSLTSGKEQVRFAGDPIAVESDPAGEISRTAVAQKAAQWLLGGKIDRVPKSKAVASARRRQAVTEETRRLTRS